MASIAKEHQVWINYLQPEGLVVSSMVLEDAGLALPSDLRERQTVYHGFLDAPPTDSSGAGDSRRILSWEQFARDYLGWPEKYLRSGETIPEKYRLFLPEYNETIAPTHILIAKADGKTDGAENSEGKALALIQVLPPELELDKPDADSKLWIASPKRKLERLLRATEIPIGILTNKRSIVLVYAPRGENTGSLAFPVDYMATVMGRSSLGALLLLLDKSRLWTDVPDRRLPALLEQSRKAQAKVSTALAQQVLAALYELLRGFSAAKALTENRLLERTVEDAPQDVYGGLLAVLMRLVFLLYAEDRGLMPASDVYIESYSVHGLWSRLREGGQLFPDTMDLRYGAWASLLALFRAVFEGCDHPELKLPPRRGHLFDPKRYPFLEGEEELPPISDGCMYRVLDKLLMLRGEKLSYRTLDVEQIGSVYEAVMGFQFQVVQGLSIAIRPKKAHGAPPIIDLDALLAKKSADRKKTFKEWTERDLNPAVLEKIKSAESVDDLLDALKDVQDGMATPHPVPAGGWVLHPTDERRRSGSHYTPRSLTAPIVEKALEPIWLRLGEHPQPEEILDLNVCDPAMGSGAFLVESCRQIADKLIEAWHYHDCAPVIPNDEDEVLHARRIVAQCCLYGVDRNPMAVDLAKLSLWLATLAKDHPFTFLDHALRCGDSLVGLSRRQIMAFHWNESEAPGFIRSIMEDRLKQAVVIRKRILASDEASMSPEKKAEQLRRADEELGKLRLAGDLVIAAWFGSDKDKERITSLEDFKNLFQWALDKPEEWAELEKRAKALRFGKFPVFPFHWELEFPEVFSGEEPGFDCFVGNPPFLGGKRISKVQGAKYNTWIVQQYPEARKNADLVSHFFRRAFLCLKEAGSFGLIATNTIAQGDTRSSGLRWICTHGGSIYNAIKRLRWPGEAAVIVSVVHIQKIEIPCIPRRIDGYFVPNITAYLFHQGDHNDPRRLVANLNRSFQGSIPLGMGFTFDDTDRKGIASPISKMDQLINEDPNLRQYISPYIGGKEVNTHPRHANHRYIINLGEIDEEQAKKIRPLFEILEKKVKPARQKLDPIKYPRMVNEWWKYWNPRYNLYERISKLHKVIATGQTSKYRVATFLPSKMIFDQKTILFSHDSLAFFSILSCRLHEMWAEFFGSTMKDDPVYTPTDCFETFPFPAGWETNEELEAAGKAYYEYRAALMIKTDEGLTKTYNRFHDPNERATDIQELRRLHGEMDRAVLAAYGWVDIPREYGFYLDYEEEDSDDEENSGRKKKGKKKPWRYRWPDEIRDLLLARLLELNARQAAAQGEAPPLEDSEDEELSEDDEGDDEDGED